MPDYVTMSEMNGLIPAAFLVQALDDDADGAADVAAWADVLSQVHKEIDGPLGKRFTVPFSNPLPPIVVQAAPILAADILYRRRGFSGEDKNPWEKRATEMREKLEAIGSGDQPLTPAVKRATSSAVAITEKSKTTSARGKAAI